MNKKLLVKIILLLSISLLPSIFLLGCSSQPILTQDNSYTIEVSTPPNAAKSFTVSLPWNVNQAIMQKLLLESSFVLSDLHTIDSSPSTDSDNSADSSGNNSTPSYSSIIQLKTEFPKTEQFTLLIDGQSKTMSIKTIKIEVLGPNIGLVTLNDTETFQGINDPNLTPAFLDFFKMLPAGSLKEIGEGQQHDLHP